MINKNAIGVVIKKQNTVLSNHIITRSLIETSISDATIVGIVVENITTWATLITEIINLVTRGAFVITITGKNISASPSIAAFAASSGSGILSKSVSGYRIYPK